MKQHHNPTTHTLLGKFLAIWLVVILLSIPVQPVQARFPAETVAQPHIISDFPFAYDPVVAQMIANVRQVDVYEFTASLTGENSVNIGGAPFKITSRNTRQNAYISKATQYVYEFMQAQGLSVHYENWSASGISNRNVVGEITGVLYPSEIILISAHLDDMPNSTIAPGADDNASGSVAVMTAAARMAGHRFERTVRFVFFTGEEQGLLGSDAYASAAKTRGDNILAVFNMDMIAWDDNNDGVLALETRYTSSPGYANDLAIANVFLQVVDAYGLDGLDPFIDPIYDQWVDSASFWDRGFSSVTAIEDWEEGNPYYHTAGDTLATLNMPYFTNFVKASLGTVAHMAAPVSDTTFIDVPDTYWAWEYIQRLYDAGVTGGCSSEPMMYCPTAEVTRDQMSIFLLLGEHGSTYIPPTATGNVFDDVPADYWAAAWIEQLVIEGLTGGCGDSMYCPGTPVTRDQMAVFLLRGMYGKTYFPPAASGTMFGDVPADYWAAAWIEQLAAEGITGGCGEGNYCPNTPVTRDQMAVFLVKAFALP